MNTHTVAAVPDPYSALVSRLAEELSRAYQSFDDDLTAPELKVDFNEMMDDGAHQAVQRWLSGQPSRYLDPKIAGLIQAREGRLDSDVTWELDQLLESSFESDVADTAEQLGIDIDDLVTRLKEDSVLTVGGMGFTIDPDVTCTGQIDVTFDTGHKAQIEPNTHLLALIEKLRIPPGQFLQSVKEYCIDRRLKVSDARQLGIENAGAHPADAPLFELYLDRFNAALASEPEITLRPYEYLAAPVVSADELVDALAESWPYGKPIYVHTSIDGADLHSFGSLLERSFAADELEWMNISVKGVLSGSSDPSDEFATIPMAQPLNMALHTLGVSGSYGESLPGKLCLPPVASARADVKALLASASQHTRRGGLPGSDELDRLGRELAVIFKDTTPFVRDRVLDYMDHDSDSRLSREIALRYRQRDAKAVRQFDLPQLMGRDLLAVLSPGNENDDEIIEHAEWLVRAGADVATASPEGITPLHIAVQASEVSLVKTLLDAGADMNATFEASYGRPHTAMAVIARQLIERNWPLGRQSVIEALGTLMDAGADLPECPCAVANNFYPDQLSLAIDTDAMPIIEHVLAKLRPNESSEDQALLNGALWDGAVRFDIRICKALLDFGADPDTEFDVEGLKSSIEEAVFQQLVNLEPEDCDMIKTVDEIKEMPEYVAINQLLLAARAKKAMASVISAASTLSRRRVPA